MAKKTLWVRDSGFGPACDCASTRHRVGGEQESYRIRRAVAIYRRSTDTGSGEAGVELT